jgi:hypothetical protein
VASNDTEEGGTIDPERGKHVAMPPTTSQGMAVGPETLAMTRDLAERAQRDLERVQGDLERVQERLRSAQAIQRFCTAVHNELEGGRASQALRLIRDGSKPLDLLRARSPESAAGIEALRETLLPTVEDAFAGLVRSFPRAARDAGLELDASSRHPGYTLCDGFLSVQFQKRRLETRITPRDGRPTTLGIDLPVVIDHLKSEVDRLCGRPFDAAKVLSAIETAYAAVVSSSKKRTGDPVRVKDLVAEMSKDKSFRADEFNIDLSRLVRSDEVGPRLQLDNSRDAKNGVLLWQLDRRGYYGYIRIGGSTSS